MTSPSPTPPRPFHRFSHEAMTTTFDILIVHSDEPYARGAAQAAFNEILRYETLLSRYDPGTDISQVNRLTPGQYLAVNFEVLECLELAASAYTITGGAFDPCFRSTAGGTRPSAMDSLMLSRPDDPAAPGEPAEYLVGIHPTAADHPAPFPGAEIDLGAIGKGFALDKAAVILQEHSLENFLLNSGTSTVLAHGPGPEGRGWTVGVSGDYRAETGVPTTDLLNSALSGSGTAVKGEHIRDPHTGAPAPAMAAWARAASAAWSDALSTALMVLPRPRAEAMLASAHPPIQAIVIYHDAPPLVYGQW